MNRYSYPRRERAKLAIWRGLNNTADWIRAPFLEPQILLLVSGAKQGKIDEVKHRLEFLFSHFGDVPGFRVSTKVSLRAYAGSQAIAVVDADAMPAWLRRRLRWVADLDYETNPSDGWALMELGASVTRDRRRAAIEKGRAAFMSRVDRIKSAGPRPVYIFGTGPSLQQAAERSFADGTTIVCNTIVRDPELWQHLRPSFFTAGDAIYHFGHTAHARQFRADALQRLRDSQGTTLFVYPEIFDVIIRAEFREVEDLLVPIPWGEHENITVNLADDFTLPHLGNVLNALLLPLGCTISSDVRLWGFDGRAPTDSGFWANSSRHAYPELMDTIKHAHPAFFASLIPAGNEVQYVNQVHGDKLDEALSAAEDLGMKFQMLHHSWTPTLQKRYRP